MTNIDARQIISRDLLAHIANATGTSLDALLRSLNSEATPPFELKPTSSPSLTVNIGSAKITNPVTGINRTVAAIAANSSQITSGSIVFPASSGGNCVVTPGNDQVLTLAVGQWIKATIYLDANDDFNLLFGDQGASEAAANALPAPDGTLAIGFVSLHNIGGVIQPVTSSRIYQFVGVGGAGGSGNANELYERLKDYFIETNYEFLTPVIFASVKDTLTDVGNTTAVYSVVNKTYKFSAGGQKFTTIQMADPDYISQDREISQIDLVAYWKSGNIDTGATYRVSRDNGGTWSTVTMVRVGNTDTFRGQVLFTTTITPSSQVLKVEVTSSASDKDLAGIGIFYGATAQAVTGVKPLERFVFSGNLNTTSFVLSNFKPDPDSLKVYDSSGNVYRYGIFDISGMTVTFASGQFLSPGETITLTFEQIESGNYDSSPDNAALLAENRLGSVDPTRDRSVAGEGILLRATNGLLVEASLTWNGTSYEWTFAEAP